MQKNLCTNTFTPNYLLRSQREPQSELRDSINKQRSEYKCIFFVHKMIDKIGYSSVYTTCMQLIFKQLHSQCFSWYTVSFGSGNTVGKIKRSSIQDKQAPQDGITGEVGKYCNHNHTVSLGHRTLIKQQLKQASPTRGIQASFTEGDHLAPLLRKSETASCSSSLSAMTPVWSKTSVCMVQSPPPIVLLPVCVG